MPVDDFELLHRLRIKGRVAAENLDLEAVSAAAEKGDVKVTPRGVLLTAAGMNRHRDLVASTVDGEIRETLERSYDRFLKVNSTVKDACSRWQAFGPAADEDELLRTVDVLERAFSRVNRPLSTAGLECSRFEDYRARLEAALEKAAAGDRAQIASPAIDSFHTVWFECHEDFIVSLGRTREEEE